MARRRRARNRNRNRTGVALPAGAPAPSTISAGPGLEADQAALFPIPDYAEPPPPIPRGIDPMVRGQIRDQWIGGGVPEADITHEYATGGGRPFPLIGQIILSQGGDDLSAQLGLHIYDAMLQDPAVSAMWNSLVFAVLAGGLEVVPRQKPNEGETETSVSLDDEDRFADIQTSKYWADFTARCLNNMDRTVDQLSYEKLYAGVYGCRIQERVLKPGTGDDRRYLVPKALKTKQNQSWNFLVDPFGNVVSIRMLVYGGGLQDLPPEKFDILTWFPIDRDPRGRSALRPAYNPWKLKLPFMASYFRYMERWGTPSTIVIAGEKAQEQQATDANGNPIPNVKWKPTKANYEMAKRLYDGAAGSFGPGTKVDIHQATGEGQAYNFAMQWCDRQIALAIIHAVRAIMEAEHGSKADSESALSVVRNIIVLWRKALAANWETFVRWLITLNAGEEVAARHSPEISLGTVKDEDVAKLVEAWTKAGYLIDPTLHPTQIDGKLGLRPRDPGAAVQQVEDPTGDTTEATNKPAKPTQITAPTTSAQTNGKPAQKSTPSASAAKLSVTLPPRQKWSNGVPSRPSQNGKKHLVGV